MNTNFLNQNADVITTQDFDYNSIYRAVVMNIDDPEHLGRIKVKIPSLHSRATTFPYAYPATMTGLGYQTGQFILPPVGSIVFVAFEYGDEHRIIYFGGVPTKYAEGKTQSYGAKINDGVPVKVDGDDLPTEYTGSQAIIYKAPSGAIIYTDSATNNNKVYIGNSDDQALVMQKAYNATTDPLDVDTITDSVKLQLNENSYLQLDNSEGTDKARLFLNGQEVPFGESGYDKNYYYTQNTASDTWVIRHNLGKYPSVTVVSSSGDEVLGDVHYDDINQVTLTFKGSFKGKATLN